MYCRLDRGGASWQANRRRARSPPNDNMRRIRIRDMMAREEERRRRREEEMRANIERRQREEAERIQR